MSREKSEDSNRGKPVALPAWWLEAVNRRVADVTHAELGARLATACRRPKPFSGQAVGDFLRGKVTTDVMMDGFIEMFPELPPPIIFARSYEEADHLRRISGMYRSDPLPVPQTDRGSVPRVNDTIEDTGERRLQKSTTTGKRRRAK